MMSLLWYYRPEHLQGGRSPSMHEVSRLACVLGRVGVTEGETAAPTTWLGWQPWAVEGSSPCSPSFPNSNPIHVLKRIVTFVLKGEQEGSPQGSARMGTSGCALSAAGRGGGAAHPAPSDTVCGVRGRLEREERRDPRHPWALYPAVCQER